MIVLLKTKLLLLFFVKYSSDLLLYKMVSAIFKIMHNNEKMAKIP